MATREKGVVLKEKFNTTHQEQKESCPVKQTANVVCTTPGGNSSFSVYCDGIPSKPEGQIKNNGDAIKKPKNHRCFSKDWRKERLPPFSDSAELPDATMVAISGPCHAEEHQKEYYGLVAASKIEPQRS